jgi:hypothetical protein
MTSTQPPHHDDAETQDVSARGHADGDGVSMSEAGRHATAVTAETSDNNQHTSDSHTVAVGAPSRGWLGEGQEQRQQTLTTHCFLFVVADAVRIAQRGKTFRGEVLRQDVQRRHQVDVWRALSFVRTCRHRVRAKQTESNTTQLSGWHTNKQRTRQPANARM